MAWCHKLTVIAGTSYTFGSVCCACILYLIYEPRHDKTWFCNMRTTKAQTNLRIRAVWSTPLFSLPGWYSTSTCYSRNFKTLASLCSWAGRFESYPVANPERQVLSWRGSILSFLSLWKNCNIVEKYETLNQTKFMPSTSVYFVLCMLLLLLCFTALRRPFDTFQARSVNLPTLLIGKPPRQFTSI